MTGYLTAAGPGFSSFEDKRSRFLSHVLPVSSEAQARDFLETLRRQYPDATHHVYAYRLREGGVLRWSDDGEPGGTSGQPTLAVLQGAELWDVCCVTVRYFGGTLLGSGGLVRAYSAAARLAVADAGIARMSLWRKGAFACSYARYERLRRMLEDRGARIEDSSFGAEVELVFSCPEGQFELLSEAVRNATAGEAEITAGESVFRAQPSP